MQYGKRIEINNLKEIQQELINYNFFKAVPDLESFNGPLKNLAIFQDAWGCSDSNAMVLPEAEKVNIW